MKLSIWPVTLVCSWLLSGCGTCTDHPRPAPHFAVVERSTLPGGGGWDFITLDPVGQRLFIARGDRVQVWSLAQRQMLQEIADTSGVHGVALAPELKRGYTSNGRGNSVSVFDLDSLQVLRTLALPGLNPDAVLYEPVFKRVYVFNGRSHDVNVIDAQSLKLLATLALGGKPEVAVSDASGQVYVNIQDKAEVVVIAPGALTVGGHWSLAPCSEPTGLAMDVAHQRLFSVCSNQLMMIMDAQTGRIVDSVAIGLAPDGVAFDAGLGLAFSTNGEGSLSVVQETDPEHYKLIDTEPTQDRARTIALDAMAHQVYTVTAQFGPTPAASAEQTQPPRPPVIEGSFTVLRLAPR